MCALYSPAVTRRVARAFEWHLCSMLYYCVRDLLDITLLVTITHCCCHRAGDNNSARTVLRDAVYDHELVQSALDIVEDVDVHILSCAQCPDEIAVAEIAQLQRRGISDIGVEQCAHVHAIVSLA